MEAGESPDNQSSHVDRQARRSQVEVDPYKLRLKFSPHGEERIERVISEIRAIGRSEESGLTRRLIPDLEKLSSGRVRLVEAMQLMAEISHQLQSHTKETGNVRPEMSWELFVTGIQRGGPATQKPFTLTQDKVKGSEALKGQSESAER